MFFNHLSRRISALPFSVKWIIEIFNIYLEKLKMAAQEQGRYRQERNDGMEDTP
jgi:hypothetical protein